jgi:hypothetical protein
MNKNKKIVSIVIGVVILVAVFYGGMVYGKSKNSGPIGQFGVDMQNGLGQFNGIGGNKKINNGGMTSGEIISKDDKSITIKLTDGGSKIIFFDTNTTVSKMATGALTDLVVGTQISSTGTTNSDGSVTAKDIQIRPQVRQNIPIQ